MKFIDNKNKTLLDDLRIEINSGSKIYPELFMHIRNCICKWLCIIRHQYH